MNNRIIYTCDPYKMDMIENINVSALNKKNADFIEAVIRLDSNYKKESQIIPPDNGFDIKMNSIDSKGKYCGSTKYWFDKIINDPDNYQTYVHGAVISIDRSNSTHLETTKNGREIMAKRIIEKCPDLISLKRELEKVFFAEGDHLIVDLIKPGMKSIKSNDDMFYLSFASKFCSYASELLDTSIKYSKYDNVVATALPIYALEYLGKRVGKTTFKVNNSNIGITEKYKNRLNVYEKYCRTIDEILTTLKKYNIFLTKDEFDHIIWYGMKGN